MLRHSFGLAVWAVLVGVTAHPLQAADADPDSLQREVADLKARLAELEARVPGGSSPAEPPPDSQPAAAARDSLESSLQMTVVVNELLLSYDDGKDTGAYQATTDAYTTRLVFRAASEITEAWSGGFWTELGFSRGRSALLDQSGNGSGVTPAVRLRRASAHLKSETFGQIRLGQSMPATRSIILANANDAIGMFSGSDVVVIGGSLRFRNADGTLSGLTPGNFTVGSLDTDRRNLVRYDSPAIRGASVAVAWAERGFRDVGIRLTQSDDTFRVTGGIGYANLPGDLSDLGLGRDMSEIKGSVSLLHNRSGLFLDGAGVRRQIQASNGLRSLPSLSSWFLRGGLITDLFPIGATCFLGEFSITTDALAGRDFTDEGLGNVRSSELQFRGVAVAQRIDAASMVWYLAFRQFDGEASGDLGATDFNVINTVFLGTRILFGAELPEMVDS